METNKKLVFIADDDADYMEQTKFHVESFGFETVTASSRKEAETLLETVKPDLFIFDLMMEEDDSGFILSYKAKKKYPDVPVILATAVSSATGFVFDNEANTSWIKADAFLEKGIRPDQLQREINRLLKL